MDSTTEDQRKTNFSSIGIILRGVLMGLAEVVPGVSGGTMAFITGIYTTLIEALASFGPRSIALLAQPKQFYDQHNLKFLLLLALGMVLGIVLFAQLMHYLLAHAQPLVWAFFCGVIVMSAWVIGQQHELRALLCWLPVGFVFGLALLWIPSSAGELSYLKIFFGGMVAVSAWLLPAVSGSYVLLTLGLYGPVIAAVAGLDVPIVATLALGCAVGLFLFTRILSWLLHNHGQALLSLLTGFMLGSVPKLWPWQLPDAGIGFAGLMSPAAYSQLQGDSALVWPVALCFFLGMVALWLLSRLGHQQT